MLASIRWHRAHPPVPGKWGVQHPLYLPAFLRREAEQAAEGGFGDDSLPDRHALPIAEIHSEVERRRSKLAHRCVELIGLGEL